MTWPYESKNALVKKLAEWDASAWCDDGWVPDRKALFASRALAILERWRAAWFCLRPPAIMPGYSEHGFRCYDWWTACGLRSKACFCLVLGLHKSKRLISSEEVVYFDSDGRSWSQVEVGWGVFENWFAYVEHDSEDCEHG